MASRILRLSTSSPQSIHPLRSVLNPSISRRALTTAPPRLAEGDLGNPQSSSSDQAALKKSRATKGATTQDTGSVAQPVSNRSAIPGDQDEGTPTEDAVKRSPEEPAEKKRESVEKQGQKPLGVEDEQK